MNKAMKMLFRKGIWLDGDGEKSSTSGRMKKKEASEVLHPVS